MSPDESVSRKNFNTCPLKSLTISLAEHNDISSGKFSLFFDWTSFDLRNDQYDIIKGLMQFCVDHFIGIEFKTKDLFDLGLDAEFQNFV